MAFFLADGENKNFTSFKIRAIKNTKSIILAEPNFPSRIPKRRSIQRFSIFCLQMWLVFKLFLDGFTYESVVLTVNMVKVFFNLGIVNDLKWILRGHII